MAEQPWTRSMPEEQFKLMRRILGAASPIGMEAAMTRGVLEPHFKSFMPKGWTIHTFRGNAGVVLDTHPGCDDMFTVMIVGHADKIRLQVRSIGDDGKIWVQSDSFIAGTLIGHEVLLYNENPDDPGHYRLLKGGTLEAVGAIHFAPKELRSGKQGIKPEQLYVELQIHGKDKRKQIEKIGIRPGDSVILKRKIRRGFAPDTFYGAYLDNGLGCFVTAEVARLIADEGGLKNIRLLGGFAAYEEIGRFGSRVFAQVFKPDVLIGVDVSHDYVAAPTYKERRFSPTAMGQGFTLSIGAVLSAYLNSLIESVAVDLDIPYQRDVVGRDSGTDAMAAVLASVDASSASLGFPIRNMHTISECGHTGDVLATIHVLVGMLKRMEEMNNGKGITADDLCSGHPRLDVVDPIVSAPTD